jgi:hypothetical protein
MFAKYCSEYLKGRDYSEDLGVARMIILQWFLRSRVGRCGLDSSGPG